MAKVHLQREWYRPKLPVIHYVSKQRVLVRSRPARVRNPQTKAQQANRHKLSVASRFLSQFQEFAVQGFREGKRPNGRPVGAYHMALGHLLNKGMSRENGQWRIDYKHVELSEGQRIAGFPVTVHRDGRALSLAWDDGLPEGTRRIRLAFHNAKRRKTQYFEVLAPKKGNAVSLLLPKWARAGALHMWWSPVVNGKTQWKSRYLFIPEGMPVVVGGMAALASNAVHTGDTARATGCAKSYRKQGESP